MTRWAPLEEWVFIGMVGGSGAEFMRWRLVGITSFFGLAGVKRRPLWLRADKRGRDDRSDRWLRAEAVSGSPFKLFSFFFKDSCTKF